jgi:Mg-chelatase subunit ChlD
VGKRWGSLKKATQSNKDNATNWTTQNIKAGGGTDINGSLLEGLQNLKDYKDENHLCGKNIVLFLSDGQPSSGVTDTQQIVENVTTKNSTMINASI